MNLFDVENFIDEDTFSRGRMYIAEGRISKIKEPYQNHFVIEVADDYTVDVVLDTKENILKTFCDCAAVPGSYCEHTAAALMALGGHKENDAPELNKVEQGDLDTALSSLPKEELILLLREAAAESAMVEQRVLAAAEAEADPVVSARNLVRGYIERFEEDGFISFYNVPAALEGAHIVLDQAEEKAVTGETELAVRLSLVVLAEVVEMLAYADDSGGEPGDVIHQSLVLLHQAATGTRQQSEKVKERVFATLLPEAEQHRYGNMMEARASLLRACIYVADTAERRSRLETVIEQMQKEIPRDSWQDKSHTPLIKMVQLEIHETYDSNETVSAYLKENMLYPEFRRKALDMFMNEKAYDRVLELCDEALSTEDRADLRRQWKEYKLDVYEKTGDTQNQKALLLEFLYNGEDRYYERLKRLYDQKDWGEVLQEILNGFDGRNACDMPSYLTVLKEEQLSGRILECCQERPRLLLDLHPYLMEKYPEKGKAMFILFIKEAAKESRDRKKYRQVCRYIQEYKKACGSKAAFELRGELKNIFRSRPAFVNELEKMDL